MSALLETIKIKMKDLEIEAEVEVFQLGLESKRYIINESIKNILLNYGWVWNVDRIYINGKPATFERFAKLDININPLTDIQGFVTLEELEEERKRYKERLKQIENKRPEIRNG